MKGLILKDLYTLRGFQKQYLICLGVMVVWGFFMKNVSFVSIYAIILGGLLVMSSISLDEAVHFDRYAIVMPVSSRTIIKSKYLLLVLTIGIGTLFAILVNYCAVFLPDMSKNMMEWESIAATGMVFVICYSITLPVIFKIGVEKARYIYIFVTMFLLGAGIAVMKLCDKAGIAVSSLEKPGGIPFALIILGICAVVLLISYEITVRVVKKREW